MSPTSGLTNLPVLLGSSLHVFHFCTRTQSRVKTSLKKTVSKFKCHIHRLLAVWPWVIDLTSLSFSFWHLHRRMVAFSYYCDRNFRDAEHQKMLVVPKQVFSLCIGMAHGWELPDTQSLGRLTYITSFLLATGQSTLFQAKEEVKQTVPHPECQPQHCHT